MTHWNWWAWGLLALLVFWGIGAYNRVMLLRNAIGAAFAQFDEALTRRIALGEQLVTQLRPILPSEQASYDTLATAQEELRTQLLAARDDLPPDARRQVNLIDSAGAALLALDGVLITALGTSPQAALGVWRALFFTPGTFAPGPVQSAEWNRGAYLVNGLGHCAACHTPRNALGASDSGNDLAGGLIPQQNWYAPSLTSAAEAGVAFVAAGHHATERYGVQALGEHLAQTLGLDVRWVDIDNPI